MAIRDWFGTNDHPKTGSGVDHPRLPAKKVKVTMRTADGKKITPPKQK
jgi:hypothetical protein